MLRHTPMFLLSLSFVMGGCLSQEEGVSLVSSNPFDTSRPKPTLTRVSFSPAATETAARVDLLGRKIVAANPQLGLRPLFRTVGAPQPELFHRGTVEVDITEGLVSQCQTEGQLAAILCYELGRMVSERGALAGPKARTPDREPPMEVRVGNDGSSAMGSPDLTSLAEKAKYDRPRRGPDAAPLLPPDPRVLAISYLVKAQFSE